MNILNALVRLRDDIKTWVANNLEALDAKIDKKTISVDSELSSTSTNPVQNKVIKKAIDNIPTFSGDYNDLTDAPNISEDDSGNMVIVDENGNIIFSVDAEGAHTTSMTLNGQSVEDMINGKVDKVDGKGLSTNDYTTTEKNKLAGIAAGAEKNVQPDWNQNDENAPDYVKNRTHYVENSREEIEIHLGTRECSGFTIDTSMPVIAGKTAYQSTLPHREESPCFNYGDYPIGSKFRLEIKQSNDCIFSQILTWHEEGAGSTNPDTGGWVDESAIGNADLTNLWNYSFGTLNTGELASIYTNDNDQYIRFYLDDTIQLSPDSVITISLYYLDSIEKVVQLDEKYIPDTIAKVVDIKNGTYFTEAEKYDILVDTTTINVEAEDFYYRTTQSPFTAQIIDGNKYLVIFDEVSYICYGRKYNKMNDTLNNSFDYCLIGDVVFNNGNYSRPISGSNLPFCIVNDYFENTNDFTADVLVFGDTASTHTIKIVDVTPTVKKLPEEFLADNFKAVTKGFGEKSAIFGLGQEASGAMSIAAGQSTVASGWMSIALGLASKASGAAALTLGQLAEASGTLAVAHGFNTKASGAAAVAAGDGTIAGSECQLVHGKFNIEDTADTYAHIVGGGENNMNRKNIYALDWTGNASFAGQVAASSIKIGNTIFTETQLLKILNFIETVEIGNN